MKFATIEYEVSERVLTITLKRPKVLNAFSVEMGEELLEAYRSASEDDEVAAVIVTGSGEKAFCAGMDLSAGVEGNVFGLNESLRPSLRDLTERYQDPEIVAGVRDIGGRISLAVYECKKPLIAAINGAAVGIGATMTLPMDVRLASENARIGFVFGRLGIVPEACSSWFLPRLVGLSTALEWCYRAEPVDADEALRAGLLRAVYPAERLLEEARALAKRFVDGRSPVATALIRQMLLRNSAAPDPAHAHRIESLGMFYASLADGKEGVQAFREKRKPNFQSAASKMPPFYPWWESEEPDGSE